MNYRAQIDTLNQNTQYEIVWVAKVQIDEFIETNIKNHQLAFLCSKFNEKIPNNDYSPICNIDFNQTNTLYAMVLNIEDDRSVTQTKRKGS